MDSGFSVLFVCTGNVCRSPLAQLMLRRRLPGTVGVTVASAGVGALVGDPMSEPTQRMGRKYGLAAADMAAHRARQLAQEEVEAADLVLTMNREQRRGVVELSPRATRRVFTLREFARLAKATAPEDFDATMELEEGSDRLRAAVRAVTLSRASVAPLTDPAEIDIPDPYRQPEEVHVATSLQIYRGVDTLAEVLRQASQGSPGLPAGIA